MNPGAAVWTRRPFAKSAEGSRAEALSVALAATTIVIAGLGLRVLFGPQVDGLDDAGYLDAAQRVASGRSLDDLFPLFRTRVGMAYVLGWLIQAGWAQPAQFWILTLVADAITMTALIVAGTRLSGRYAAGLWAAGLYAVYPLSVQQSMMFYPTAFQVASIAVACACIATAWRADGYRTAIYGAAAGVSLGLGYLFKEDVAVAVAALALAVAIAQRPRVILSLSVCAGAAAVFAVECIAYWYSTGQPLFRLTATSGLGAPIGDQLQIAEIWRWDAYLRSLFLLPVQVGVLWWLAVPALWKAFTARRDSRGWYLTAIALLLVMAYLQFGSGSVSSYSPLPKTPRYTALATPLLMLVVGAWLARLSLSRPRLTAAIGAGVFAAALPCLFYLQLSSSERTRNTIAAVAVLEQYPGATVFTDFYSARVLRQLQPQASVQVWYHANFVTNRIVLMNDPETPPQALVLLDRQAAKIYTSSYEMQLPETITGPPSRWTPLWQHRAFEERSVTRQLLEWMRDAAGRLPNGNPLSNRVNRSVSDMIDGDAATLYRVH